MEYFDLDYFELKIGLEHHDVIMSPDEFRTLVALVDPDHKGALSAEMFTTFMEATDAELTGGSFGRTVTGGRVLE